MRHATKAGVVVEAIFILIGLALLVMAATDGASAYRFSGFADHADGVITSVSDHGFRADVEYTDGRGTVVVFSQVGPFFNSQIGKHVPVVYDQEHPAIASVSLLSVMWFRAAEAAAPGLIFLFIGWKMRSGRNL